MEFHKAVAQAAKVMPKGKDDPEVLRGVRLFSDHTGNWVHATDGEVGCVIGVGIKVPDMVLDADNLAPIVKHEVASIGTSGNIAVFDIADDYRVVKRPDNAFPPIPPMPTGDMQFVHGWFDIAKIFHMAVKAGGSVGTEGVERPDLECIHFLPDRVEATDTTQIGVADIGTKIMGLVPGKAFKSWPKGPVFVGTTDTHAWFKIGDEWRYAVLRKSTYAQGIDLRKLVPELLEDDAPSIALGVPEFIGASKKALDVSSDGWVTVTLEPASEGGKVTVKGESFEGLYECELEGPTDEPQTRVQSIVISGKLLYTVVRALDTPRVSVYFCTDGTNTWLRLESGSVTYSLYGRV